MGKILHFSGNKLLRYGNFTNSILKSFGPDIAGRDTSYIIQTFLGKRYELLAVSGDDSIDRTSYMSYENMNATHYYDSCNLKLHSNDGYWGNGTMDQTSNYLVKEENVIPFQSLSKEANVAVDIPNTLITKLLNTYIYFFVTLDNSILGYNGRLPVGVDFPREPEIYPYNPMTTDYVLNYKFNTKCDRKKNLYISTIVPAKTDCYANVFIFIQNRNSVACRIKYNYTSPFAASIVNTNFLPTKVLRHIDGPTNSYDTIMTGVGYSLYVDNNIHKNSIDDYAGEAEITFNSIS